MIKRLKIAVVILSLAVTLCLMNSTYSRYVASTTGDLDMALAKWQILVNETDITNQNSTSIDLVPVIEENQNISDGSVAPSTKGYFDIDIDPSNVEVSFDYNLALEVKNEDIPDLMITKYAILDDTYIEGDVLEPIILDEKTINGSLNYQDLEENEKFKPFTIRVYFEWYEGENEKMNDEADSVIGNKAATEEIPLQITATINFTQNLTL